MEKPFISVIIPIFNEERYIEKCVDSMLAQDYPREKMEWFFVDGMSKDRTVEILQTYREKHPDLIHILENPHKIVPYAMNIGIRASRGRYIIRLDAHAQYAQDYFSKCVEVLEETGADNVGGVMETKSRTPIGATIAKMLSSKFGVGNSQFRTHGKDGYVDTVPFGAFRREIFDKVGLYDERLVRNQDIELNYRITHNGGKIYLSSKIKLAYFCRDSVKALVKQARMDGKWNIITSKFCPGSMGLRHFIPFLFLMSLIGMPILTLLWKPFGALFALELLAYFSLGALFAKKSADSTREFFQLLALYPTFHISYGWGSLTGMISVLTGRYS